MNDLAAFLHAQLGAAEARALNTEGWSTPGTEASMVLREVDAHRRIIALHSGPHECPSAYQNGHVLIGWAADGEPCTTLRLLALPYADHRGYRSEWAPRRDSSAWLAGVDESQPGLTRGLARVDHDVDLSTKPE